MKHLVPAVCLTALMISSSGAQAPDSKAEREQIVALAKEVQIQQAQIAANQARIDAKLAEVAEIVRMARIFSSRGR